MIRARVPREAENLEASLSHLFQLLHTAEPPAHHHYSSEPKRLDNIVCRFSVTRGRVWKDFETCHKEPLLSADGGPDKVDKTFKLDHIERAAPFKNNAFGDVARVQTMEQQHGFHLIKVLRVTWALTLILSPHIIPAIVIRTIIFLGTEIRE